jgi:hypothetical protein
MQIKPGQTTPDYPFVLGYSISQKLPAIETIVENAKSPPLCFIPRTFMFTTTPGKVDGKGIKVSDSTLNFCMLTHRDLDPISGKEPQGRSVFKADGTLDLNAGVLPANFFDKTSMHSHDGVMAFCQDLIMHQYIAQHVAPTLYLDPVNFKQVAAASSINTTSETKPQDLFPIGNPRKYLYRKEIKTSQDRAEIQGNQDLYEIQRWSQGMLHIFLSVIDLPIICHRPQSNTDRSIFGPYA